MLPLARLYAGDTAPLTARVDTVAARLRTPERRVAASIAHLGLAARLWSVALGCAALHGELPDLDPARLHWDPRPQRARRSVPGRHPDPLPATAATVREAVQYGHLVPLADALTRRHPDLAGSCCGATRAPRSPERCANCAPGPRRGGRPEVAERASALAAELFAHPDLSGTVHGPARCGGAAAASTTAARAAGSAATASSTVRRSVRPLKPAEASADGAILTAVFPARRM